MYKKLLFITSLLISMTVLSACQPHRIDIQQGNRIKPETLAKLKTGMSRKQVVYVLGSPLLTDPFHQDRWDYIYYLKPGNKAVKQSRLTLYFDGDNLARIDDSAYRPQMHGDKNAIDDVDALDPPPELGRTME